MTFGAFDPQRPQPMMSDINVTPMVDVMLVLLVIFILTAPLFTHKLKLDLPAANAAVTQQPASSLTISIDAAGRIFVNDAAVTLAQLDARLAEAQSRQLAEPAPLEILLRADKNTRYEVIAQVMAAAQARGLTQLGFVTDPQKENAHGQR